MSVNVSSRRSSPSIFEMCEGAADDRRREDADADADAMHSRLVAYVHALAEGRDSRSGVWMEHSYARARGAAGGGAPDAPDRDVRVLLAARAPSPPGDAVDVDTPEPPPPEPPDAPRDDDRPEGDAADPAGVDDDDDWEARVAALAPTPAHARLADATFEMLRRLRLARLAGRRAVRREDARAAAHRLRLAMAGGWAAPGPAQQRPPAWLHAALHAYLPRELRPLYEEVTAELRRAVPKLAERLFAGRAPPPPPLSPAGEGREGAADADADAGPVLAWLRTGRDRLEERWERRLRRVLHTRPVAVAVGAGAAPPEAWCAAAVGAARAALADAVAAAAAAGREVVAGGVGAGAALCAAALCGAGAARVAGALLLAPALVTAEGGRDAPDDPLGELRAPALLVVGARAGNAWRGAARAAARARLPGAPRRLVEVRGADHLLRLGHAARRRLALSQRALDAAVADECARWAAEVADAPDDDDDAAAEWRAGAPPAEEEEYSHLPASAPSHTRAIEIVEGRVVSRVSGGTPLALAPPRRPASASSTPPPALAAADIMQLPIVFADDAGAGAGAGATAGAGRRARAAADAGAVDAVTVTSGEARVERRVKYARVIVAKRGGGVAGGGVAGRGAGGATPSPLPVVVRRGVRVAAAPRD